MTIEDLLNYYMESYKEFNNTYRIITSLNPNLKNDLDLMSYEKKHGHSRSFLHGIPFVISDNIKTSNMDFNLGYKPLDGNVASESANVVKKLKKAGMILFGKANTSDFSLLFDPKNDMYEPAINPFSDLKVSGAATAVALSMTPFALDMEIKGSVLLSSAHLSLVGLKLPSNLVDLEGTLRISKATSLGIVSKEVIDIAYMLNVLSNKKDNYVEATIRNNKMRIGYYDINCKLVKENINHDFIHKIINVNRKKSENNTKQVFQSLGFDFDLDKNYDSSIYSLDNILEDNNFDLYIFDNYMKVFDSMVNPILSIPIDEKSSIYVIGKTNNMTDLLQFGACVNEMFSVKRKIK